MSSELPPPEQPHPEQDVPNTVSPQTESMPRPLGPTEYHIALLADHNREKIEAEIREFVERISKLCMHGNIKSDAIPEEIVEWSMNAPFNATSLSPSSTFRQWAERQVARDERIARYELSDREYRVASFVAQGLRNKEIAAEMGITEGTVKSHKRIIFRKMKVTNSVQVTLKFLP